MIVVLVYMVVIFVIFIVMLILMYNGLVRVVNEVSNSWSGIDVQLKRRADLVPNLVEAVKGYMKHEKEVLESVTKARVAILHSRGVRQSAAADSVLEGVLMKLFMVAENYPKLQASENFLSLQNELARIEDEISASRRIYNDNVRIYNTKIETVPMIFVARLFNFRSMDYFRATAKEKENIHVDF
jgi:LemA protein